MSAIKNLIGKVYQRVYALGDQMAYKRGVDFSTWVSQEDAGFDVKRGNQYQPSSIPTLKRALAHYRIRRSDALMDIGCGKGKVMCVCAKYPFAKVGGLELSPALAEIARKNFATLGLKQCEVLVGDAASFSDYDDYNYFYMFNPFPEEVFRAALQNIAMSVARRPRKCVLFYMNPIYHDMIEAETPFRLRHQVKAVTFWFSCCCYEYQP